MLERHAARIPPPAWSGPFVAGTLALVHASGRTHITIRDLLWAAAALESEERKAALLAVSDRPNVIGETLRIASATTHVGSNVAFTFDADAARITWLLRSRRSTSSDAVLRALGARPATVEPLFREAGIEPSKGLAWLKGESTEVEHG